MNIYQKILERAVALKGISLLARHLDIPETHLDQWLQGKQDPRYTTASGH